MDTDRWESIDNYLIKNAPPKAFYIPNFITEDEENYLIKQVYQAPKPKWTCLTNRRLQDYGGIPHKNGMITESIPVWLQNYMDRISDLNIFYDTTSNTMKRANHCLINEYKCGEGIMPHFDGPIFTPVISTISCGTHTLLEFFQENNGLRELKSKLVLEPRSLVVLSDEMYTKYLHSISNIEIDVMDKEICNLDKTKYRIGDLLKRDTRISFTIRNVPKVIKCSIFNINKK